MEMHEIYKVVIITESIIENKIIEMIKQHGASGYTIQGVSGEGEGSIRSSESHSMIFNNVKFEILASEETANKIVESTMEDYFYKGYAGVVYTESINIVRVDKFK